MNPESSHSYRPAGSTLVLVLACLVLLSAVIIAFFSSVAQEVQSSRAATGTLSGQQLADSAVQLVMAQIREATSRTGYTAWASQPGLIRTYGTGTTPSAAPLASYKLYSSDNMVVSASQLDPKGANWRPELDLDDKWPSKQALYTDLNSPVPVLDPSGPVTIGTQKYSMIYPILDPYAQQTVEGFKIDKDKTPWYQGATPPPADYNPATAAADVDHTGNPAAMPVKWIYVLRDGTLTTPASADSSGQVANWKGVLAYKQPSKTNPIVGRIAFWTDDETSKININTAAGDEKLANDTTTAGAFWDSPRTWTAFDQQLSRSQVAQFEFQRYPGHPATIALTSVFPDLKRDDIATLTPRVVAGGSRGGTFEFRNSPGLLKPDTDRLYASIHELVFPSPTTNALNRPDLASASLPAVSPAIRKVNRDSLERARFFLTAHSRSPEVNLFGRPRVSIWPVHEVSATTTRTPSDQLLAFCSVLGGQRYNFTRGVSTGLTNHSRTLDYNPRNKVLYEYLRNLTEKRVPGFDSPKNETFVSKYTTLERDQILTEIYDYVRSTNLVDGLLAATGGQTYTQPKKISGKQIPGTGQAVPIKISTTTGDTKGFGRFATVSEAALQFYATELVQVGTQIRASKMRAVLLLETFCPAQGHAGITPDYYHIVRGLDGLQVKLQGSNTPVTLNFAKGEISNHVADLEYMHGRIWSGTEGIAHTFYRAPGDTGKKINGTDPINNYAFISQTDIPLTPTSTNQTFTLMPGKVDVEIQFKSSPTATNPEKIQLIHLYFPEGTNWPLPRNPGSDPANPAPLNPPSLDYNFRIGGIATHDLPTEKSGKFQSFLRLVDPQDTVRSLEPSGACQGDFRLVAAREEVPESFFKPHANYLSTTAMGAHSLRMGTGGTYPNGSAGKLVTSAGYVNEIRPDMPSSITTGAQINLPSGIKLAYGDWDTGMAGYLDGPYINKPDEGTTSNASWDPANPPYYTNTDDFDAQTLYSPNRQVSSPVMFGSLSTGVIRTLPWQTLLFHPDAAGTHPGSAAPKDHLLLDLFTMPIVEPYAISEPCSTAGKVNMNYQIAPFSYIQRTTPMRAALASIWTMAIPAADADKYKSQSKAPANYRSRVNIDATLAQFKTRFDSGQIFRSATEICDLELIPTVTPTGGDLLTGDNTREMPYTHLYPLLTTKSNTYTVHVCAQALQKSVRSDPAEWDERKDRVIGEYRGSSIIERFIDPDDPLLQDLDKNKAGIQDFANVSISDDVGNLEQYYRTRVISAKRFAP